MKFDGPQHKSELCEHMNLLEFQGCIGLINGTLVKIHKPWNDGAHKVWFNGHKNIYSMNNSVVANHRSLFIYLDSKYPSSYHDVTILH
jgi:hypothetical protein